MPKINVLPNTNNQLPAIKTTTVKANTLATPSNTPEKIPTQPTGEGQQINSEIKAEASAPIDPKFEALAKKETALREREKVFQAKEAALEARVQEAVTKAMGEYRSRVKESPLDVLNEEGITYDQLVESAVNAPDYETREIRNELKALKDAQAKLLSDSQKASESQHQAAITQLTHDVTDLVNSDPNFETIKGTESVGDVVQLIERTYSETGKIMSVEDAAKLVEEELFQEAMRIASFTKVKSRLTPEVIQESKQPPAQQQRTQTLTNSMTTSKPMSARERAIKRFKGENF